METEKLFLKLIDIFDQTFVLIVNVKNEYEFFNIIDIAIVI